MGDTQVSDTQSSDTQVYGVLLRLSLLGAALLVAVLIFLWLRYARRTEVPELCPGLFDALFVS